MLGFSEKLAISARGRGGGICMMWSNSVNVKGIECDNYIIALDMTLVGFYGPPHAAMRRAAWENLSALLESIQGPWVCFGDFNVVISDEEKSGGRRGSTSTSNYLKEILFDLGAVDLGFSGNKFSWSNRRWGRNSVKERLDRGIASMSWRLTFPRASILHLSAIKSDHCPLLLDTNPSNDFSPCPFRFEAA